MKGPTASQPVRLTPSPARPHTGGPGRRAPARAVGKRPPAHPVQLLTAAGQKPPPDSRERGGRGPRRLRPVPPSTSTLGARGAAPLRQGRSPAPLAPLASPDTPSPCLAAAGAESRRAPVCDRVARSRRDGGRGPSARAPRCGARARHPAFKAFATTERSLKHRTGTDKRPEPAASLGCCPSSSFRVSDTLTLRTAARLLSSKDQALDPTKNPTRAQNQDDFLKRDAPPGVSPGSPPRRQTPLPVAPVRALPTPEPHGPPRGLRR